MHFSKSRACGFTLIELLVTLALIGIAATAVFPFRALIETRAKETELRVALRTIRQALDNYKAAADAGVIEKSPGCSGYPATLDILVTGAKRTDVLGSDRRPMMFLRQIPRDPFFDDRLLPADKTWNIRSYGAAPGDYSAGPDVFDVASKSSRLGLNSTRIADW